MGSSPLPFPKVNKKKIKVFVINPAQLRATGLVPWKLKITESADWGDSV